MKTCKKCIHGCELACRGFGCDLMERPYVVTIIQSMFCHKFISLSAKNSENEYMALQCLKCGTLSIFPSGISDGSSCLKCGGHTIPVGTALIKQQENLMIDRKPWEEFRKSGFLWWINMILHTLGWAIVVDVEDEKIINCYPARVKYRGFSEKDNTDGYIKVSEYINKNSQSMEDEAKN